jgi:hypothetical protein
MSSPYAFPVDPTLRADKNTSIPPAGPKVQHRLTRIQLASAVGLPQPSEASRAFSGTPAPSSALYSSDVVGSQLALPAEPPPQQEALPDCTRVAACPYVSFTTSLISSVVLTICSPVLIAMGAAGVRTHSQASVSFQRSVLDFAIRTIASGSIAWFRVQHSAYKNPNKSCNVSVFAEYLKNVLSRFTETILRF